MNKSRLEPELIAVKEFIDKKARKECGETALKYSSTYIKQLSDHIDGVHRLSSSEIEVKLKYLVGCLTITLDMPMKDLEFLRARRCEGKRFSHRDELSYIKSTTEDFPKKGRLNKAGQSLFYATVAIRQDDRALNVVLSEVKALDLDRINVLRSHQKSGTELKLRMVGIWDYVRTCHKPYYLSDYVFDYYKEVSAYMEEKFSSDLFRAYQLADRFLADIMSRKGSETIYEVTSIVGSFMLESGLCDGILFSSVSAKWEPVVALTPSAVEDKLQHQWVSYVEVQKWLGYEFYIQKTLEKTVSIDSQSGSLRWPHCKDKKPSFSRILSCDITC